MALSRVKDVGGQVLAQVGDARRGAHAQSRRRRGSDPPPRVYRVSPDARTATTVGGAAGPHCLRQTGELCRGAARRRAAVHVRARKADGAPSAVGQATTRLRKNVNYFKVNYLIWILTVLTVCMLANPQSLFVLSGALARARARLRHLFKTSNRRYRRQLGVSVRGARRRAAGHCRAPDQRARKAAGRIRRFGGGHLFPPQRRLRALLRRLHRPCGCVMSLMIDAHAARDSLQRGRARHASCVTAPVRVAGVAVHGSLRVPDDLFLDDVNVRVRMRTCGHESARSPRRSPNPRVC